MSYADKRVAFQTLLAVGGSGLVAETIYIGWSVLTEARGTDTSNAMLAEAALVAMIYGLVFAYAIVVRMAPPRWFTARWPETSRQRKMRDRFVPLMLAGWACVFLLIASLLAIRWSTPYDALVLVLHSYPMIGLLVAVGFAMRGARVREPAIDVP